MKIQFFRTMQLTGLLVLTIFITQSHSMRIDAKLISPTQLKISCLFDDASSVPALETDGNVRLSQHGKPVYSDIANVISQVAETFESTTTTTTAVMSTRTRIVKYKRTSYLDRTSLKTTFALDDEHNATEKQVSTTDRSVFYMNNTLTPLENVTHTETTFMNLTTGAWEILTTENHTYITNKDISTRMLIIIVGIVGSSIVLVPMILVRLCLLRRHRSENNDVSITMTDNVIIEAISPESIRTSVNQYDTISLMSFPTIADSVNMFIQATTEIEVSTASVHYYEWVPDVHGEGAVSNDMSEPSEQQTRTHLINYESLPRTRNSNTSDYSNLECNMVDVPQRSRNA